MVRAGESNLSLTKGHNYYCGLAPKLLNHCVIFILYIKYADMSIGQIRATGWTPMDQCKLPMNGTLLYVTGVKFAQC